MDQSRPTLWYEDLDRHRQPSLYYLSTEDDKSGPHLICDWNGAPTNFEEFDIDMMGKFVQQTDKISSPDKDSICPSLNYDAEEDQMKFSQTILPKHNCSQTLLTEEDGSQFDFLTVPPMARSLIKRLLKTQPVRRPKPIPEEPETMAPIDSKATKKATTSSSSSSRTTKKNRIPKSKQGGSIQSQA